MSTHNHTSPGAQPHDHLCCREMVAFLQDYAEGTLAGPVREAFERHVNDCLPCKDFVKTYVDTIKLAGKCSGAHRTPCKMPEGLVQSIMSALREFGGCSGKKS
ncbi:MAG: zf-HC2 domain-containing protein [Planctomycetota bacterium]|nr:zf-HC2 domain-containing protein [Planctomycetota bacterium]